MSLQKKKGQLSPAGRRLRGQAEPGRAHPCEIWDVRVSLFLNLFVFRGFVFRFSNLAQVRPGRALGQLADQGAKVTPQGEITILLFLVAELFTHND